MSTIGPVQPPIPEAALGAGGGGHAHAQARGAPKPPAAEAPQPTQPSLVPQFTALDRAVAEALGRQPGLATLFASVKALAGSQAVLPPALRAALGAVLGAALPGKADGDALRRAVRLSGVFHEAALAATGRTGASLASADLKTALAFLRSALTAFLARSAGARSGAEADAADHPARPDPSRPGAPPRGEPAARLPPSLAGDPAALARLALAEIDRAEARVLLHQAASIEERQLSQGERGSAGAVWRLDLPVETPAGIAIAALRVERDGARDANDGQADGEPTHRVELAIDVEPLGPLEVRVGLLPGRRLIVGIWCAHQSALDPLRGVIDDLEAALRAAGFDTGPVDLRVGHPPPARPEPATAIHRLDLTL